MNVFCLAADPEGDGVLAGTSGEGLLFRVGARGELELLADFVEEEVQRLLVGEDGFIYAGVARSQEDCEQNCAAVHRLSPGGVHEMMLSSDSAFVGDLIAARAGGILVATGDAGELDRLTDLFRGEVLALEDGAYFSDLYREPEADELWLLQAKPARLFKIGGMADRGTLSSEVMDLGSRSRAGVLRIEGEIPRGGGLRVLARAGQSPEPGPGWSDWRECKREGEIHELDLPVARYFQWRVELRGKRSPRIDRITVSFLPLNRAPIINNLSLLRPMDGLFDDALDLSGRPVTQVLERGVRVQYQQRQASLRAREEVGSRFRGLRQLQWDWLDPDLDIITARIELRRRGETVWQVLEEDWEHPIYTWDTRGLPDGRYRVRVTVSDTRDNRAGDGRSMTAVSEPVLLDSSAPEFEISLKREKEGRLRVRGSVTDRGGSVVTDLERRSAEGEWIAIAPVGGFLDRPELKIDLLLHLEEEEFLLELRAADELGNWRYFRQNIEGGP